MILKPSEGLAKLANYRLYFAGLKGVGSSLLTSAQNAMSNALSAATKSLTDLSSLATRAFKSIATGIPEPIQKGLDIIESAKGIVNSAGTAASTVSGAVSNAIESIKNVFSGGEPMTTVLRKGATDKSAVVVLQNQLNSIGYSLVADGLFGDKTDAAVRQFQTSHGLTADGIVGAKTWEALDAALRTTSQPAQPTSTSAAYAPSAGSSSLKTGDKSADVSALQMQLNRVMGANLAVDGDFGPKTQAAVKAFQTSLNLAPTGVADAVTLSKLASASATPSPAVPPAALTVPVIASVGSTGVTVTNIQQRLNLAGYTPKLKEDGIFGEKTAAAVKWYQKAIGQSETGVVTTPLYERLMATFAPGAITESQVAVMPSLTIAQAPSPSVAVAGADDIIKEIADAGANTMVPSRLATVTAQKPADAAFVESVIERFMAYPPTLIFFNLLNGILPNVLRVLAWHESHLTNSAVGKAMEVTAFQLHPTTITSLKSKYSLGTLNTIDPTSVAIYLQALIKDQDGWAPGWWTKDAYGNINGATAGHEFTLPALQSVIGTTPRLSQSFLFFMQYNVGGWADGWTKKEEEWRRTEAMMRSLSLAASLIK